MQGPALSHYCLVASNGTEPVTCSEFRNFVLDRFIYQGSGETIQKLCELRCEGSLDQLAMRVASVLAQGVPPPQTDLVRLFLASIPLHMMVVNLNHLTKRGRKPRTGKDAPIITKGRRVVAAQVPAHTH